MDEEKTSICNSIIDENGKCMIAINDMNILEKLTPSLLSQSKALIQHASVLVVDCNLTEKALEWLPHFLLSSYYILANRKHKKRPARLT